MSRTLDMQFIRYMNLFEKISRVRAKHCFSYNNSIIFVIPSRFIPLAIGQNNSNLQKLSKILLKRIRIVPQPRAKTLKEIKYFIETIISPVKFNELELKDQEAIITAGMEDKARLIGRERIREKELKDILGQYFGIESLRII